MKSRDFGGTSSEGDSGLKEWSFVEQTQEIERMIQELFRLAVLPKKEFRMFNISSLLQTIEKKLSGFVVKAVSDGQAEEASLFIQSAMLNNLPENFNNSEYFLTILRVLQSGGEVFERAVFSCLKKMDELAVGGKPGPMRGDYMFAGRNANWHNTGFTIDDIYYRDNPMARLDNNLDLNRDMSSMVLVQEEVLRVLAKFEGGLSSEDIDYIISCFENHRGYPLGKYLRLITKILNREPALAAQRCLKYIETEYVSGEYKNFVNRVLFQLELGSVMVDKGVVDYLNRKYFLSGEKKEQVERAYRVTADGKIGLFDEQKQWIGYFELGNLSDPTVERQARIMSVTLEMLFADPQPDEEHEEMKTKFLQDYYRFFHDLFNKATGIYFNNLPLREQFWFYQHISKMEQSGDIDGKERVVKFLKDAEKQGYGRDAARSLIALEQGAEAGEKVLAFAESKKDTGMKKEIFEAYGEIIAMLDSVEIEITEFFKDKTKAGTIKSSDVTKEIAKRAWAIFIELSEEDDKEKVTQKVNLLKGDIISFAIIFKTATNDSEFDFNEIVGASVETLDSSELSLIDKDIMRKIFYNNRLAVSKDFADARVQTEFDPVINETGHQFSIYKQNGKILAFVRFDKLPNGNLYAGFLNARTDIQGLSVGSKFFKAVLDREAHGRTVEIKVRIENQSALNLYEQKLGFQTEGEPYIDDVTKKEYVKMIRPLQVEEVEELALAEGF